MTATGLAATSVDSQPFACVTEDSRLGKVPWIEPAAFNAPPNLRSWRSQCTIWFRFLKSGLNPPVRSGVVCRRQDDAVALEATLNAGNAASQSERLAQGKEWVKSGCRRGPPGCRWRLRFSSNTSLGCHWDRAPRGQLAAASTRPISPAEQICVTPTTFCGVSLPRNGIVVTRSGQQIGWVDAFAAGVWTMTIAIIAVAWLAFLVGFVCLRLWVTREAPRGAAEEVPLGSPVQHRKRSDWCRPRRPDAHRRMRIPGAVSRRAGLVRSQPALPDQREGVSGGSSRVSVQRTRPDKAGCPSVDGHRWLQARDRPF